MGSKAIFVLIVSSSFSCLFTGWWKWEKRGYKLPTTQAYEEQTSISIQSVSFLWRWRAVSGDLVREQKCPSVSYKKRKNLSWKAKRKILCIIDVVPLTSAVKTLWHRETDRVSWWWDIEYYDFWKYFDDLNVTSSWELPRMAFSEIAALWKLSPDVTNAHLSANPWGLFYDIILLDFSTSWPVSWNSVHPGHWAVLPPDSFCTSLNVFFSLIFS